MSFLYTDVIKSVILVLAFILIAVLAEFLVIKRIENRRTKTKIRVTLRNVLIILFIGFMAKIWVEGFGHFLALIGFVSAALTITQKENILNLTGGLIIMWRDAFDEGDYISIENYSGIIKHIGIFYFTLEDTGQSKTGYRSGKLVKVPNAYISLHPFVIHPAEKFILLERLYVFSFYSDVEKLKLFQKTLADKATRLFEDIVKTYNREEQRQWSSMDLKKKFIMPTVDLTIEQDGVKGYQLRFYGHTLKKDQNEISKFVEQEMLNFVEESKEVSLAHA